MLFNQNHHAKKLRIIYTFSFCLLAGILASGSLSAQAPSTQKAAKTNFSDSQLKSFVHVNQKLIPIKQMSQEQMMKSIKKTGLTVNRFNEIAWAKQQGKKIKATKKENKEFKQAAENVMAENKKTNEKMEKVIQKEGIDIQTFQQIAMAYRQDPKVQKKIKSLIKEKKKEEKKKK